MTDSPIDDTRLCYAQAIAAMRLAGVVAGRYIPRPDEPVDIVTLACLRGEHGNETTPQK